MNQDWICEKIGNIGKVITGKTPPTKVPEYFGTEYPFITPSDMDGRKVIDKTDRYLSQEGAELMKNLLLQKNSICVSCIGWQMGKVVMTKRPSFTNQQINSIIPNEKVDENFIYYALSTRRKELLSLGSSTGVRTPILNKTVFSELTVLLPPLPTQQKIAAILSAYDDLIENNTRRIEILEEMAETLYYEWFVRYRFPGHEQVKMVEHPELGRVPEGWDSENLFTISELTYGFPFKSKDFNEKKGHKVIRIRDIPQNKTSTLTPEKAPEKYFVEDGDLLIGMDGDFHMGKWAGGKAYLNQRVVRLRPNKNLSPYYLFLSLKEHIRSLNQSIVGTTVAHLGDRHLKEIDIFIPDQKILDQVNQTFNSIFELEIALQKKNKNLRETRDLLLPMLISGELDVSEDVDIVV